MKLGGGKENRESERSFARKTSTAQKVAEAKWSNRLSQFPLEQICPSGWLHVIGTNALSSALAA